MTTAFVTAGESLKTIRDDKLYKARYRTFADYCRERWQMERRQAYRLIEAAAVNEFLCPIGHILPANESVARPLTRLLPEPEVVPRPCT